MNGRKIIPNGAKMPERHIMHKQNDTFKRLRAVMKDVNGDHRQIIKTMQDQIDYLMEFIDIQGEILEEKTGHRQPELSDDQKKRLAHRGKKLNQLAVDFYGGNCRIGGGSPWTKDGSKADLTLNLLAREKALNFLKKHSDIQEVHCSIACRIGSPEIIVSLYDGNLNELTSYRETVNPAAIIDRFFLRKPRFAQLCRNGLLS